MQLHFAISVPVGLALLPLLLPLRLVAASQSAEPSRSAARAREDATTTLVEGRGRARSLGVDGELRVILSSSGAFRIDFDSPLPSGVGSDGTRVWTKDRTGLVRTVALEEADTWKVFAWVLSGFWHDTDELLVRPGTDESTLHLALIGTPLEMTLSSDPESGLPVALELEGDGGTKTWTFGDHRAAGGRLLPHRWTFDEGAGEERFEIESWRPVATLESPFLLAPELPDDFAFDPEIDPELEVSRASTGHLLVEPLVEDRLVGLFVFDTGAGVTVIDRAVADELGLESVGETSRSEWRA